MSASLRELLRQRYAPPAWAFLEEVRNQTGYNKARIRTADAVAMSLYPSRGLHLHGFELKVSRADWKKELDDPSKAEELAQHCHFWWLVIDDPKIVQNGELPQPWGLLVRHGEKLKCEKEAAFNKDAKAPDHAFLAAVLRKVATTATEQVLLDRAREEGRQAGYREGEEVDLSRSDQAGVRRAYDELVTNVSTFEKASGITLQYKSAGLIKKLGTAVRMLAGDWGNPLQGIERLRKDTAGVLEQLDAIKGEIEKNLPRLRADEDEAA